MRILLLHQYFLEQQEGGGSRFNEMARIWHNSGHDITVLGGMIHPNGKEKLPEYKRKYFVRKDHDGVEVIRCHVSESYNVNFLGRLWGYFSFVFSSLWAGLFYARKKYDVILVTSPPLFLGITAFLLSRIKRVPYIFEVRDLWPESAIDTGVVTNRFLIKLSLWLERFSYKKAILVNVLTPAFREKLINDKNVPSEKICFIPNAADFGIANQLVLEDFDAQKIRKGEGWEDKLVLTYVGAHGVANHLEQVLDAAEKVRDDFPQIRFVLIGSGMRKDALMEDAARRKLYNVIFKDSMPKKDVFKYIMASDFGMSVLKRVDTFKTIYSNKTFDYMSCKKPILLAIDGVSRQLVEDAECGFYIEPENISSWYDVIKNISKLDADKINRLGTNGYDYAKIHFDRVSLADEYIKEIQLKINPS